MHDEPPKLLTPLGGFFVGPGRKRPWLAGIGPTDRLTPTYSQYREISRQVTFNTVVRELYH
jgi:hypothetical protein